MVLRFFGRRTGMKAFCGKWQERKLGIKHEILERVKAV
jgi:hypothetical protein